MQTAIISTKFQICIPKKIREQLHIKAGQQFIFIAKGNTLHLVPQLTIENIKGALKGAKIDNFRDHSDRV